MIFFIFFLFLICDFPESGLDPLGADRCTGGRDGGRRVPDGAEGPHEQARLRDPLHRGDLP